ncbi:MAG: sulfatase-like hydrolase/transferase [Anaerolineae bacterium]|nr:sulfatase-like hydrolase/transferase [Anaerolineae bacterium]
MVTKPLECPPNIVWIMPDDCDFRRLGCYGGQALTPAIDRIAAEGIRCEQMYCSSSTCTPSRYAYLTGQYAGRCSDPQYLEENPLTDVYKVAWNPIINETTFTISKGLSDYRGYRTGIAGKWHAGRSRDRLNLPALDPDADPDNPAVDKILHRYQEALSAEVKRTGGFDYAASIVWGDIESFPVKRLRQHNLEWITKGALDFLSVHDERPFFLHVAPTAIHGPSHEQSYQTDIRYTQGGLREDLVGLHPPRARMRERLASQGLPYDHHTVGVTWIDDLVAAILDKLDALGQSMNTLIIFSVDHNTEPGKGTCHHKGVHIPLIMRWPAVIEPGRVCRAQMQNVDLAPTLFDATGITPPEGVQPDSVSWLPLLTGETDIVHEDLFFEFGYARAVQAGRWRYIALRYPQHLLHAMESGALNEAPNHINDRLQNQMCIAIEAYPAYFDPDQLFDIENDPDEQHNLAGDPAYAGVLANMKQRLQRYLETFEHPYDLDVPAFMRSERYQALCEATRKIGTGHIGWWKKRS